MIKLSTKQEVMAQHPTCKLAMDGRNFVVLDCNKKLHGFEVVPDGDYKTEIPIKEPPVSRAWVVKTDKVTDPKNPRAGIDLALREAFQYLGNLENYVAPADKVIIKVNLGSAIFDEVNRVEETVSHPDVVASVIDALLSTGVKSENIKVAEANSTWVNMDGDAQHDVQAKFGYTKMMADKGVDFLNLTKDVWIPFKVMGEQGMIDVVFPKSLLKDQNASQKTKIISIAPMKRHFTEGVTLSQKNMFGAIPESLKVNYHRTEGGLRHIIAAAARIMRPDIAINDGVIGCALDHALCVPVNFKRLVVSNDPVCADRHTSEMMYYPYQKAPHIQLAIDRKDGDPKCPLMGDVEKGINTTWKEYDLPPSVIDSGNTILREFALVKMVPNWFIRRYATELLHPTIGFLNMIAVALSTGMGSLPEAMKEGNLWGL